ncbi:MAG: gamma-glutamyl-gamma-aminobutyrate hydrolase family protein [Chloroflexus sp.]|jgi:putative glutamine amidotransferase|uniref:gamma-glutamyl-gamma-aminobutyrate hydrolase family protein n=1 Tax=Chloroflexus sp. Y-396-1 TaxID=867845 RepID=UPI000490F30C|nr:gamma-glutamyl-gamma-aminobutyrate hydrolase family protein [Chloroflexus sp. Y-396-1]MBO9310984.1 gamma-glutamyl-gamma-aminobutyrate hydrolase family protein [Chloroflexus sp.]MBO9374690.1 gamma-glutamyl-gamma-aminobutyrate hydrolase family protein [Chloroflexus sp.]
MTPLIGISCGTFRDRDWCPPSYGHRQTYIDAVLQAGGAPLLIPPLLDAATLRTIYERLDGVLLAGGGDIAPNHYGDQPHERLGTIDPPRDLTELRLARWAAAEGKPLLGICRGVQLINVALGGSLYQDIPSQIDTTIDHNLSYTREDWTFLAHPIAIAADSRLAQMLGTTHLMINSLHHQAVRRVATGLRAVAWAPDGVIEALESEGPTFIIGVQGHPEALQATVDPRWQNLFAAFVQSCGDHHRQSRAA